MRIAHRWVLGIALVASFAASAAADPVLSFDPTTGTSGNNATQSVGWQFNVLESITVVGLGWYDQGADGLSVAYEVGIWAPDGTLLASVIVPSGTSAPFDGQFRTVAIAPLVLGVGAGYIVGGLNSEASTDRLAANVAQTLDSRIVYVDATYSALDTVLVRPDQFSAADTGFYGPSFSVAPVPEPASLALGVFGLAGAGLVRLARRRPSA